MVNISIAGLINQLGTVTCGATLHESKPRPGWLGRTRSSALVVVRKDLQGPGFQYTNVAMKAYDSAEDGEFARC